MQTVTSTSALGVSKQPTDVLPTTSCEVQSSLGNTSKDDASLSTNSHTQSPADRPIKRYVDPATLEGRRPLTTVFIDATKTLGTHGAKCCPPRHRECGVDLTTFDQNGGLNIHFLRCKYKILFWYAVPPQSHDKYVVRVGVPDRANGSALVGGGFASESESLLEPTRGSALSGFRSACPCESRAPAPTRL
ncbi:hypothetical protein EVAR_85719_1 [Eumeta japonica]|uniref:Uncharacterized protein n=1 Tax=Eumeta variegata TaxID=151549 RepID=A0A4C1Y122_EUMVA|nr:hypothetical protein EVAR_85719_1 [Eumeta japonica]